MPEDMTPRKHHFPFPKTIDKLVQSLPVEERGDYIEALRQTVGSPGVGGSGQYLGSLVPLVFATADEKVKAIHLLNRWNQDSYNK